MPHAFFHPSPERTLLLIDELVDPDLSRILDRFNQSDRDPDPSLTPDQRQRARETAYRAASLLVRLTSHRPRPALRASAPSDLPSVPRTHHPRHEPDLRAPHPIPPFAQDLSEFSAAEPVLSAPEPDASISETHEARDPATEDPADTSAHLDSLLSMACDVPVASPVQAGHDDSIHPLAAMSAPHEHWP